jgi:hypothetical protein
MTAFSKCCRIVIMLIFQLLSGIPSAFTQTGDLAHLHLDRALYLPGDIIFFKAYLFQNNQPSSSTNLHGGIYDLEGHLLQSKTFPILFGTAQGDFKIPDSFSQSGLQLRIFTKTMLAETTDNSLLKLVPVYQRQMANQTSIAAPRATQNIAAFPEGGQLVSAVINHIVFKAKNFGSAQPGLTAALMDDENRLVDSLFFNKDGLAKAQFIPQPGKTYFLKWNDGMLKLPPSINNAVALHTETGSDKIFYVVHSNSGLGRLRKLRLQIRDQSDTIFSENIHATDTVHFSSSISTAQFPPGLFQMVLTDEENNLLQQKQILIKPASRDPQVRILEQSKMPKGKNRIEIALPDTALHFLSVAVVDDSFMPRETNTSMKDELFTGATNSYLARGSQDAKGLEMFLMTLPPVSFSKPRGLPDNYLTAVMESRDPKSLLSKSQLTLIISDPNSGKQFFNLNQNGDKKFIQPGLIFFDSARFYYQLNNKQSGDDIRLQLLQDVNIPQKIAPATAPLFYHAATMQPTGLDTMLSIYTLPNENKGETIKTIETVVVKSKYENPVTKRLMELDEKYSFGMYRGLVRGVQFNLVDDPNAGFFSDLYSYLANKIPSVRVETIKIDLGGGDSIRAKAFVSIRGGGQEKLPLVLLIDEMETTFDVLETLPVSQIAYVKAVTGIFIGSSFSSNAGAIMVYTKKPDDYKSKTPAMKSQVLKGYDMPAAFMQPDYTRPEAMYTKDYRPTLFWDPNIISSKNNTKFIIEYFNNDLCKNPILVIKGISESGHIIEFTKKLE